VREPRVAPGTGSRVLGRPRGSVMTGIGRTAEASAVGGPCPPVDPEAAGPELNALLDWLLTKPRAIAVFSGSKAVRLAGHGVRALKSGAPRSRRRDSYSRHPDARVATLLGFPAAARVVHRDAVHSCRASVCRERDVSQAGSVECHQGSRGTERSPAYASAQSSCLFGGKGHLYRCRAHHGYRPEG
jgi:hypothetical protein